MAAAPPPPTQLQYCFTHDHIPSQTGIARIISLTSPQIAEKQKDEQNNNHKRGWAPAEYYARTHPHKPKQPIIPATHIVWPRFPAPKNRANTPPPPIAAANRDKQQQTLVGQISATLEKRETVPPTDVRTSDATSCNAQHRPVAPTVSLVSSHKGYGNSISQVILDCFQLSLSFESLCFQLRYKNRFWQMQRS